MCSSVLKQFFFSFSRWSKPPGSLKWWRHASLHVLAALDSQDTRRSIKGIKSTDARSLSYKCHQTQALNESSASGTFQGRKPDQLEKKIWGHLSSSAWFHLYSCYFGWFCTKAARTPEVVSVKNTSVTQFTSPAPGHTQHTWLMAPVPHASFAWHQGFLWKLAFEQEQKKPHVCHNPPRGRHLKSETLSVEWQLRYMMRYRNVRVTMPLTHLKCQSSVRLHNLLLYCSCLVFLAFTINSVGQAVWCGRSCPTRCVYSQVFKNPWMKMRGSQPLLQPATRGRWM